MLNSKSKIKKHFSELKKPYASRSNWIWRFFRNRESALFSELVRDLDKDVCLDLGAGSCEYSEILLHRGAKHIVCVDFNPFLMSSTHDPRIKKIICDVEEFETNKKYDLILCLGILEFVDNPECFLIRLKSFLKPQGKIIILLPLSFIGGISYAFVYFLKGIFIHALTLKKMNRLLVQRGFLLKKITACSIFSGFAVYSKG